MGTEEQVVAHEITEFVGGNLAKSEHALIRLAGPRGAFTLAMPEQALKSLMLGLSDAASQLQRRRGSKAVLVTPVSWATIGAGPNDETLVLGVRLPGGADFHFGLPMNAARAFQEALATHLPAVAPAAQSPGTTCN